MSNDNDNKDISLSGSKKNSDSNKQNPGSADSNKPVEEIKIKDSKSGRQNSDDKNQKIVSEKQASDLPVEETDNSVIVEIIDLKKSFGSLEVLKNVNLTLKKGETVVILGRSGTGKSVILSCIIGLLEPDSGKIILFGENFPELSEHEKNRIRIKIGFLFQSGALYDSMTVRQNLEFPIIRQPGYKKEDLTAKVEEQLKNVGLEDAIDKVPSELSGGMKKRIGLARTFMLDPEVILYDEPTTGLDPFTSNEISELVLSMQKKYHVTSLIVTHDMACARLVADRIVILKDGEFSAEGTFEELEKSDDEFVKGFFEFS